MYSCWISLVKSTIYPMEIKMYPMLTNVSIVLGWSTTFFQNYSDIRTVTLLHFNDLDIYKGPSWS
jgi:hypothetical protein